VILVTVGMHTDGFPRLVQAMDRIAAQANEDVVMQIGATLVEPRAARWFTFTTQEQMETLCEQARVIPRFSSVFISTSKAASMHRVATCRTCSSTCAINLPIEDIVEKLRQNQAPLGTRTTAEKRYAKKVIEHGPAT
jgi:Fe-S oxidoreductase